MKGRIIQLVACLAIGAVIAVVFINPYIAATAVPVYVVNTQNNWWYVGSQLLILLAFLLIGFLYGRKADGRNSIDGAARTNQE
jgi:hypothetical protein